MAIDLMALEPQKISKNLRGKFILAYGKPGVGKTSLAAKFENVLIAGFEMGSNALNNVYVQPAKTWSDWKSMVSQLTRKKELMEKFHSIAIDTVDEAWNLCVKYICSQNSVENLGDIPWGQGYDMAKKEFSGTFRDLAYSGYGLIFISHSAEKTFKNEKGEEYTEIVPALPARPFDIVNKMVDLIAYIREVNVGTAEEPVRKRFMFFRDELGDRYLAKSRYRYIVPRVELDYNKLVDAIYDAIDKEVAATGGEATNEENPYTQRSFDELMEDAKELWTELISKGKVDMATQILHTKFGKPIKFSEILPDQKDKLEEVLIEIRSNI